MSGTGQEVATVLEDVAGQAGPALARDFAGAYKGILHETADGLERNAGRVVENEASLAGKFASVAEGEGSGAVSAAESDAAAAGRGTTAAGRGLPGAGDAQPLGLGNEIEDAHVPGAQGASDDPVDLVTGAMFLPQRDLALPGVLPFLLERMHRSDYRSGRWFGRTWASTLDQRVEIDDDGIHYAAPDGVVLHYPIPLQPGQRVWPSEGARWALAWDRPSDTLRIEQPETGRTLYFPPGPTPLAARPLSAVVDRNGNRVTLVVDDEGVPTDVYHSGGYHVLVDSEQTTAGTRIRGLRLAGAGGGTHTLLVSFGYDARGRLAEITDCSGQPLVFDYDDEERITAWTDRTGHQYEYRFDATGRVVRADGTGGYLAASFAYDLQARTTTLTDSLGRATVHHWNERGQVYKVVDPLGAVTLTEQDRYNRLLSRTDPLGRTVRIARDENGDPTRIERPDGTVIEVAHDASRQPTRVVGPDGAQWHYAYDERGNLLASTDPSGATTRYVYDERGHLTQVTDALGHSRRFENDPAGLARVVTDPLGAVTRIERDALGRVSALTDPLGATIRTGWSVEGRLAWRQLADGAREEWAYDGEGNLLEHRDATGAATVFEYGPFDRVVARTDAGGARHTFAYDSELRLTCVTAPDGRTWSYTYDPADHLVSETDFNGRTLAYRYDAAGQLTERINGAGQSVSFTRDASGRVIERRHGDAVVARLGYDPAGRLLRAEGSDCTLEYTRDPLGRILTETSDGQVLVNDYDPLGRRTRRTTPGGAVSQWAFTPAGLPQSLTTTSGTLTFEHDPAGRETTRYLGAGAALSQSWDSAGRLAGQSIWAYDDQQPYADSADRAGHSGYRQVQARTYSYRADGVPLEIRDQLRGTRHYDLDSLGRATAITGEGWSETYAYDALGNPSHARWPAPEGPSIGERELAGTLLRRAGRTTYEHDAQGRLVRAVRRTLSGQHREWTYQWDAEDRLTAVTTPDGTTWRYRYDPLGRRTAKQRLAADGAVAEETRFTWDGARLAEQHTTAPHGRAATTTWDWEPGSHRAAAQSVRTRAADAPQDEIDAAFYAIVTDLVGTPTELVTPDGRIAWHRTTGLWGATVTTSADGAHCPLRFPGQYHDEETGLDYNYERYYDPAAATFLSADPLGFGPMPNHHAYVANPLTTADPLGLAPYENGGTDSGGEDPRGGDTPRQTLYHYTTEDSMNKIVESEELYPSLKANNPKDARYGDGQYLTDIEPGTKTQGQLSAAFLRVPWAGQKFTHYVEVDVTGLNVVQGRPGVFVIPNSGNLDLTGRIVSYGKN